MSEYAKSNSGGLFGEGMGLFLWGILTVVTREKQLNVGPKKK